MWHKHRTIVRRVKHIITFPRCFCEHSTETIISQSQPQAISGLVLLDPWLVVTEARRNLAATDLYWSAC
jgi:hypothetical protein